ncbi:hypothetical protein PHYSODRAFT_297980 [Phytophthora sojae]|uniref:BED-type domain-containing protein n=1 Tax=Phytophthora sojae (strain P6497) TaxID=1094619 RepID=G4Z497_PHYSP|nr:hypothetical protein PHYSODRAFT_297980 [Phytophthora sojae]EGZ19403.1 hypothetical protein PHYSODRAFT_297980 [Phytophthora sojae]|eukprot:XP_009522120.1 hypothetical protein PHYSODRAFT_297980 [Phytophthora sojae]
MPATHFAILTSAIAMSSQPSAPPVQRWPPDPAHDAPSVHGQSIQSSAPHFAILTSAIAMSSPPSAPPAPRPPPDLAHDAPPVHGQSLRPRDERRALGSAPPSFLKSKKESYQAYLMPRAAYNTNQPAAVYASSPPLRDRLVFDDEALLAEAASPPHGYATPAKSPGTRFRRATPTGGPPSSCESVVTRSASRKRLAASMEREHGGATSGDRSATRESAQRKRATQTNSCRRGLSPHRGHRECDGMTSPVGEQQTSTPSKTHQRSNNEKGKRTSRKKKQQQQRDDAQLDRRTAPSGVETGSVVPNASSVLPLTSAPVLFEMYKKRKPQNWQFIQLVCKDEFRGMNKQHLRSEHARCAYCTRCNKEIKFEKSCTTYVSKHMAKVHPKDLKQAVEAIEAQKRDQTQT